MNLEGWESTKFEVQSAKKPFLALRTWHFGLCPSTIPPMSHKKALITGITGQDGSYLAELLMEKGYEVHGLVRRSSTFNRGRIDHLFSHVRQPNISGELHYGDLSDSNSLLRVLMAVRPD